MVIGWYGYFSLYVTGTDFICENLLFQVLQALFSKYGSIDVNFYAPEIEDRGGGMVFALSVILTLTLLITFE